MSSVPKEDEKKLSIVSTGSTVSKVNPPDIGDKGKVQSEQSLPLQQYDSNIKSSGDKKKKGTEISEAAGNIQNYISNFTTGEEDEDVKCECTRTGCLTFWDDWWFQKKENCKLCWRTEDDNIEEIDRSGGGIESIRTSIGGGDPDPNNELFLELTVSTYSQTLHKSLRWMWIPFYCLGIIPFRLNIKNDEAIIFTRKLSISFIILSIYFGVLFTLCVWFTVVAGQKLFDRDPGKLANNFFKTVSNSFDFLERRMLRYFWLDVFIFWTNLCQGTFASGHMLCYRLHYASFLKDWYRTLDESKLQITKELVAYIIQQWIVFLAMLIGLTCLICYPQSFPTLYRTCQLVSSVYISGWTPRDKYIDAKGYWYFEDYAWVGFLIYFTSVFFSWFSIIIYMVFCRCFRNALHLMNARVRMILHPSKEPRIGPNAIRLEPITVYDDYISVTFVGMRGGYVFGHIVCSYYMFTVMILVLELGSLWSLFQDEIHTSTRKLRTLTESFACSRIRYFEPPIARIVNICGHFVLTIFTYSYLGWSAGQCQREGREAYNLATSKGLVNASQIERNFVRSLWILASDKFPIAVTSHGYFKMTRNMIFGLFLIVGTYTIFLMQSRSQLFKTTKFLANIEDSNIPNITDIEMVLNSCLRTITK